MTLAEKPQNLCVYDPLPVGPLGRGWFANCERGSQTG